MLPYKKQNINIELQIQRMYYFRLKRHVRIYNIIIIHCEWCEAKYRMCSSVIRSLVRKSKVPGSNLGLDTFHSFEEKLSILTSKTNEYNLNGFSHFSKF